MMMSRFRSELWNHDLGSSTQASCLMFVIFAAFFLGSWCLHCQVVRGLVAIRHVLQQRACTNTQEPLLQRHCAC